MNYMDFIRPLSVILFCFVARNISDIQISKLKFSGWIILTYLLVTATVYFSEVIGSIVMLTTVFLMLYTNGYNLAPSIMSSLFTMIILVICNTTSGMILSRVYSDIDFYTIVGDDFGLFTSLLVLNYLFSHIISKLIGLVLYKKFKIKTAGRGSVNRSTLRAFFAATILVFIFIYITAITRKTWDNPMLLITYITFFVTLLVFTYFIFTTTMKETKLESSQQELKQLEEYTSSIESMYNDIRSMRHDYANVISSMSGYITDNDMEGLRKYFKNEIEPFADRMEIEDNNLGTLARLKEPSLKGIFAVKLIRAQESNMDVIVDIKDDMIIEGIDILDLNRVVGILLDNAYEAAMESIEPYVHVGFIKEEKQKSIVIVNSLKAQNINIKRIFERGFSTKGNNRGYGLNNVTGILEKYPNVYLDTAVQNNEFRQVIFIEEDNASA